MNAFDLVDILFLLLVVSNAACVALAIYAQHEHNRANREQTRGDEWYMWAEEHRREADVYQTRLRELERRLANLQTRYADLTRRLLAKNYAVIEEYRYRKRNEGN